MRFLLSFDWLQFIILTAIDMILLDFYKEDMKVTADFLGKIWSKDGQHQEQSV